MVPTMHWKILENATFEVHRLHPLKMPPLKGYCLPATLKEPCWGGRPNNTCGSIRNSTNASRTATWHFNQKVLEVNWKEIRIIKIFENLSSCRFKMLLDGIIDLVHVLNAIVLLNLGIKVLHPTLSTLNYTNASCTWCRIYRFKFKRITVYRLYNLDPCGKILPVRGPSFSNSIIDIVMMFRRNPKLCRDNFCCALHKAHILPRLSEAHLSLQSGPCQELHRNEAQLSGPVSKATRERNRIPMIPSHETVWNPEGIALAKSNMNCSPLVNARVARLPCLQHIHIIVIIDGKTP